MGVSRRENILQMFRITNIHSNYYIFVCCVLCIIGRLEIVWDSRAYANHFDITDCRRCVLCCVTAMKQENLPKSKERTHTKRSIARRKMIREIHSCRDYSLFPVRHCWRTALAPCFDWKDEKQNKERKNPKNPTYARTYKWFRMSHEPTTQKPTTNSNGNVYYAVRG